VTAGGVIHPGGGTVAAADGSFQIQFPPGAVSGPVTVTYATRVTASQPLPPGVRNVLSLTLDAHDASGQPVTTFQGDFTLTLRYPDAQVQGLDDTQLNVYVFNGTAWTRLLPCGGCSVDTATNTITIVLNHFTEFAIVVEDPATAVPRLYLPFLRR
jgi:hypothetical protein